MPVGRNNNKMAKKHQAPNFQSMKKEDLVEFLKGHSAKTTGLKPDLIERATNYYKTKGFPEKKKNKYLNSAKQLGVERKVFDNSNLVWKDISELPRNSIKELEDDNISMFLTNYDFQFGDHEMDCGTQKPAKKGKVLYLSEKVHLCEYSTDKDLYLFRCNMMASMKSEYR